ncbi:sigma-54 interaction domain-containing protein [Xylophilus sp.]|uniref:sigma-54 interaction domain-containing protein n=1 Tax=Xylophilus sp. TaxID=2653893 RepID=UPI0013B660FD|nr:sigma 54-interacting transcriptional regulator [Xylophilus sp.]KAF1050118.1 MAG: DNA-binding transcriptional regulator NtrC [Xylophilus sp.]
MPDHVQPSAPPPATSPGRAAAARGARDPFDGIARSGAPVLITGETGTGKEVTARRIHAASGRRGPFIAVNCGAFSENLVDAELFGHEAGAFTGAECARAGWFEAAQGGTLFLDEIGDLPLHLQVKLLRVLQENQVVRIGARRPLPVDVRLIAATNVDLARAVEAQRFRADLYYRLNVAPIVLAPLRERVDEILPLARRFVERHAAERPGAAPVRLSEGAAAALEAYCWPGNIRELENVVQFALIVCQGGEIRTDDLRLIHDAGTLIAGGDAPAPAAAGDAEPAPAAAAVPGGDGADGAYDHLAQSIASLIDARRPRLFYGIEELLVRTAYEKCKGNQVQAARLLGITRNTMRTLLRRFGLIDELPRRPAGTVH